MLQKIKKHKYRLIYTTITAVIFVVLILIFKLLKNKFNLNCYEITFSENQQEFFILGISLNNWGVIIAILATILGVPWGLHQYDTARKEKQQEKAAEIANKFAEDLMGKLGIILSILTNNKEYMQLISKIDRNNLKTFSEYEIMELSGDKFIIDKVLKIISSKDIQEEYENILSDCLNEEERKNYNNLFTALIETTLNSLEAACISISSQAAGSQYIYQSLHQEFLKLVHILSPVISKNNINNFDKYFTNIIAVYNMWQGQKLKDKKKFQKTMNKVSKLQIKSKREIDKLLNKQPNK